MYVCYRPFFCFLVQVVTEGFPAYKMESQRISIWPH